MSHLSVCRKTRHGHDTGSSDTEGTETAKSSKHGQEAQTVPSLRRVQHGEMILKRPQMRLAVVLSLLLTSSTAASPLLAMTNVNYLNTESFSPLHYELVVDYSAEGETLEVMTSVTATSKKSGHSLRLDFRPVACHVYLDPVRRPGRNCEDYTFEGNTTYNIITKYRPKLNNYGGVFYKTDSVDGQSKILLSNFKLEGLREMFLVIGRLQDRPSFKIKVVHPIGTIALSNSDSVMRTMWGSSLRTSFALGFISYRKLSVAVFPTSGYRRRSFGRTSVWFRRRHGSNLGKFAVLWTHQMVEALRSSLQTAPPKMDVIVLPAVAASANRGIVVLPEKDALVDDALCSTAHRHAVAETLAVNLAASWFSSASNTTPTDAWLPGALAMYYGTQLAGKIAPEWKFDAFFLAKVTRTALNEDILRKIPPLEKATDSLNNSTTLKGAAVLKMLANVVQSGEVEDTLKYLLHQESLSMANIIHGLRRSSATPEKGTILATVLGSWVNREGYPLLSVTRNYKDGSALITQEPFLGDSESSELWWVPLTYVTSLDPQIRSIWMTAVSNGTRIGDLQRGSFHWLLLNPMGSGYYRVNYDRLQWSLLERQLLQDHEQLELESRVVLLDDAFTLARHRHLEFSTALSLAMYLARETSPVVWTVAIRHFDGLLKELPYGDKHRLQTLLDEMVSTRVSGTAEGHDVAFLKSLLGTWSCRLQLPCCNFLKGDKDLQEAVLCRAARERTGASVGLLEDVFRADPAVLRPTLLAALSCSSDHNVLTRLLNSSAHGEHGLKAVETFSALVHNPMIPEIAAHVLNSVYRDTPWIPDVLRMIVESTSQETNLFYLNDLLELYKVHPRSTRHRLDDEAKLQIREWLSKRKNS